MASINIVKCCLQLLSDVAHLSAIAVIIVNDACLTCQAAKSCSICSVAYSGPLTTLVWLLLHGHRMVHFGCSWLMPIAEALGKAALQHLATTLHEKRPPRSDSAQASAGRQRDADRHSQLATQRNDSPLAANIEHADKENVSMNQDAAEPKQQTKAAKSLKTSVQPCLSEALVTAAQAAKVDHVHGKQQESVYVFRKHGVYIMYSLSCLVGCTYG